jgi:hypothetical protein
VDLNWRIQCALFLLACCGLLASILKLFSGDFGIALSTLIGSGVFFGSRSQCCQGGLAARGVEDLGS